MRRALLLLVVVLLTVPAALVASPSCQSFPDSAPCNSIPDGGCPLDRGGTCDDPDCAALYGCDNGTWSFLQTCDQPDGGAGAGGAVTGTGGGGGGGPVYDGGLDGCTPVVINTTGETMDCTPDLAGEEGDCPIQAALGCAQRACLTGCSDFFLCVSVGTAGCIGSPGPCWIDVAYCTDDGQFVVSE
jgi:hypothetical protein